MDRLFLIFSYYKSWLVIIFVPFIALLPDIAYNMIKTFYFPSPADIINYNEVSIKDGSFYIKDIKREEKIIISDDNNYRESEVVDINSANKNINEGNEANKEAADSKCQENNNKDKENELNCVQYENYKPDNVSSNKEIDLNEIKIEDKNSYIDNASNNNSSCKQYINSNNKSIENKSDSIKNINKRKGNNINKDNSANTFNKGINNIQNNNSICKDKESINSNNLENKHEVNPSKRHHQSESINSETIPINYSKEKSEINKNINSSIEEDSLEVYNKIHNNNADNIS